MRDERARAALKEMGRPVFQGGISSLLGLVLLYAGASSYIFEVFALLLGSVIILGLLHAIFVLPVLLSLFGPGPVLVEDDLEAQLEAAEEKEANKQNSIHKMATNDPMIPKPASDAKES